MWGCACINAFIANAYCYFYVEKLNKATELRRKIFQ